MNNSKYLYSLLILLLVGLFTCNAQFFKYATFYTSMSMNTSMIEDQDYIAVNKGYEETTQINPYDYNFKVLYDIRSTPQLFILNSRKEIIAKRIGAEQVAEVISLYKGSTIGETIRITETNNQ